METERRSRKKYIIYGLLICLGLSVLSFIASLVVPAFISKNYYQNSLNRSRAKANAIHQRFTYVEDTLRKRELTLFENNIPDSAPELFSLLNKCDIDKEKEGISHYSHGSLDFWFGNVLDIQTIVSFSKTIHSPINQIFLIKDKASVYLISIHPVDQNEFFVFFHLLAYKPQFKTPYLKEHHFLPNKILANCNIDYHDFRTEIQGYERIFERYNDEYIGRPRFQGGAQTLFFPLRTQDRKIVATVTLNSPPLSARIVQVQEFFIILLDLFLIFSLVLFLIHIDKNTFFSRKKPVQIIVWLVSLIMIRAIFFHLSQLSQIQSLSIFSPATAGFRSLWNLTKSPADIFLSILLLLLATAYLSRAFRNSFIEKKSHSLMNFFLFCSMAVVFSLLLLFIFQDFLVRLIHNSSIDFFRFSFNTAFILLHFSIFLFFAVFLVISLTLTRTASQFTDNTTSGFLVFILGFTAYVFLSGLNALFLVFHALVLGLVALLGFFPDYARKKRFILVSLVIFTACIYLSSHMVITKKNHLLIQNSLQSFIKSQENWASFLLEQSLLEIDKEDKNIISFFHNSEPYDLARLLWENTLLAKFNKYSRLEIVNSEGIGLSKFTLNVPDIYQTDFEFPVSRAWTILGHNILYLGRDKDYFIAYKDWFEGDEHLGRLLLFLMVDYETLPFLYSANPYFEVMRPTSMPSMGQLDLGFAIYDLNGKLEFNPGKISTGIPHDLLQKINLSDSSFWTSFIDKGKKYKCFYFRWTDRIFSLFLPEKSFLTFALEFLKLLLFYGGLFLLLTLLLSTLYFNKKIQNPLWSFSNRVYLSFIVVTLVPMILFTFSTRSFFARMLSEQFADKAEVHASFAKRVMEEFEYLQQDEQVSLTLPPDNIVLWISSTIANDVNLYQNGKLISSSRREFFDYGLFPDLIDGEIYYKIQYQNIPFYTQTQEIGDYSFQTLTIPYDFGEAQLLISLPFPQAKQELSKTTEELIDFIFLISVFLIFAVLPFARGIGGMIIRPIQKLLSGTREVSLGNLEITIDHRSKDEMKTLIDGFNAMIANLKKHQQELTDMGKKVAWAEMARKVAHEIKNPLTPIQLSAEHLLTVYKDNPNNFQEALNESVTYIIKEVENLRKIAHDFMKISKEVVTQKESFDLKNIIRQTITPYKKVLSHRIVFRLTAKSDDFLITADKDKIIIAIKNIFTNSIESIQEKGKVSIVMARTQGSINILITDTGKGISADTIPKIFDSYFSTKDVGTGLGLPIAKKIIEDHGGSITVTSPPGKGTTVKIILPVP